MRIDHSRAKTNARSMQIGDDLKVSAVNVPVGSYPTASFIWLVVAAQIDGAAERSAVTFL